jgi:hypothetical protein
MLLCVFSETGSCYVTQVGLVPTILLPQLPKYEDYRLVLIFELKRSVPGLAVERVCPLPFFWPLESQHDKVS